MNGYWQLARQSKNIGTLPCRPGANKLLLFQQCANGTYDLEPDVFSYNFAGQSGSFVIDTLGRKVLLPYRALKIEGGPQGAMPFAITTEDGTRYLFSEEEITTPDEGNSYTSSWHLTQVTPLHGPGIILTYSTGPDIRQGSSTEEFLEETMVQCGIVPTSTIHQVTSSQVSITPKTVQTITWQGGAVHFFASPRLQQVHGTKLDSMQVLQVGNALPFVVKRFYLVYFEDPQRPSRLLLTRVQQAAGITGVREPPHQFFYDSFTAPYTSFAVPYATKACDHWGFYNGADNNTTLLPPRYTGGSGGLTLVPGGNRNPSLSACLKGALTKLVYPTGGSTAFEYELNDYSFVENHRAPVTTILATQSTRISTDCRYQGPGNTIVCTGTGGMRTFRIQARQRIRIDWGIHSPFFTDQDGNVGGPRLSVEHQDSARFSRSFGTNHIVGCGDSACTFGPNFYDVDPGLYTIRASVAPPEIAGTAWLLVTYSDSIGFSPNLAAGGLRVKRITDNPTGQPGGEMSRDFSYTMAADPSRSSGCLVSPLPDYYYNYEFDSTPDGICVPLILGAFSRRLFKVYSTANLAQPGMTQGAFVGYREVTVTNVAPQAVGKSVYTFTSAYEHPDQGGLGFPFASRTSMDYARGLPLSETHYRYEAGQYIPVTQTTNSYTSRTDFGPDALQHLEGWKIGYSTNNSIVESLSCFSSRIIHYRTGAMYLMATERRTFSSAVPSLFTTATTRYQYQNKVLPHPTTIETSLGSGRSTLSRQRYVCDFDTLAGPAADVMAGALRLLQRRHAWIPIEQQTWRVNGADTALTAASLTLFDGRLLPRAEYHLHLDAPIGQGGYQAAQLRNGGFVYDARLSAKILFDRYDARGHLQQWHKLNGSNISTLWGYQAARPIAETQGAGLQQIAFTSFEPDAPGRFAYDLREGSNHRVLGGRTGRWAYRLDGSGRVRCDSLAAGDYELLFWVQATQRPQLYTGASIASEQRVATAPGGWNQFRLRLRFATMGSVGLDASASAPMLLDEVRLHPAQAQMTSYTHAPLVGITSQTDPSGRTTTYEYDGLGRLLRTRDEQGRVLSQERYQYAHP